MVHLIRRYEPVPARKVPPGYMVGTGFTHRGAQPQQDQTEGLSYYMKGKSEWAEQPKAERLKVG